MKARLTLIATLIGLTLPIATKAVHGERQDETRRSWTAPPQADARSNPLNGRVDAEAGGAKLFRSHCAQCHREDGTGTSFGKGLTSRRVQAQSDGALFWKITSGNTRTGMPTFSGLPELQRWQLVLHLRALGSSRPPRTN